MNERRALRLWRKQKWSKTWRNVLKDELQLALHAAMNGQTQVLIEVRHRGQNKRAAVAMSLYAKELAQYLEERKENWAGMTRKGFTVTGRIMDEVIYTVK